MNVLNGLESRDSVTTTCKGSIKVMSSLELKLVILQINEKYLLV